VSTSKKESTVAETGPTTVDRVRGTLAHLVWLVCVVCAVLLALGALLIALKANADNSLVSFVKSAADAVDLGVFDRSAGIKEFGGENAEVKNALFNWGLGALVWLVVGRVAERIIRP